MKKPQNLPKIIRNSRSCDRPRESPRSDPPDTRLPATAPPNLPHLEFRRAEIALHHKLGQLAEQTVRDGVGQLLGRILDEDADAKGGKVHVAWVHGVDAALEVLAHEGGLDGDNGGVVVAFGEEVLVFGEVDGVGCVHCYYFYGRVPTDGVVVVDDIGVDVGDIGVDVGVEVGVVG